jgi:Flp pilus assembly protein TadG
MTSRLVRDRRGQAATETMMVMVFLLMLVFGFMNFCMLVTTKYVVNYAAFAAARAYMVNHDVGRAQQAADDVIRGVGRFWTAPVSVDTNATLGSRAGVTVRVRVPFGIPLINAGAKGFELVGFSAVTLQPSIEEKGDNAEH